MAWIYLAFGILFEVAGSVCLKLSHGFTKTIPSILLFVFYGCAIAFASLAMKKIEISIGYTIWAGVGTAAIAIIGVLYFNESLNTIKAVSIALVIIGVIGLNLSASSN